MFQASSKVLHKSFFKKRRHPRSIFFFFYDLDKPLMVAFSLYYFASLLATCSSQIMVCLSKGRVNLCDFISWHSVMEFLDD